MGRVEKLRRLLSISTFVSWFLILISSVSLLSAILTAILYIINPNPASSVFPAKVVFRLLLMSFASFLFAIGVERIEYGGVVASIRGDESEPSSTTELMSDLRDDFSSDYELIIEIASKNSPRTSELFREIYSSDSTTESFDDLANILELGIRSRVDSPIEDAIEVVDRIIHTKKYVDSYSNPELRVIRFQDDSFYVRSDGRQDLLKNGMRFELYMSRMSARGQSVPMPIGAVEVKHASPEVTEMVVLHWTESTTETNIAELREGDLTGKDPTIDVSGAEFLRNISMSTLERIRDDLRILSDSQ